VCVAGDNAVVNGLNNFQVGFPSTLPFAGSAVSITSYPLCGTKNIGVTIGQSVTVECETSTEKYQYVIVQSIDTVAEKLCIAEVGVYEGGQYAVTFVLVCQHCCIFHFSWVLTLFAYYSS